MDSFDSAHDLLTGLQDDRAKGRSQAASMELVGFLKLASPKLGLPNIISPCRQLPVPRQQRLKIRGDGTLFSDDSVTHLLSGISGERGFPPLKMLRAAGCLLIHLFVRLVSLSVGFLGECWSFPYGKETDVTSIISVTF